jgi:predicted component of type VI protein secretion system
LLLHRDDLNEAGKAECPLRAGRIELQEDPERPGTWNALLCLRPHFVLEDIPMCEKVMLGLT